MARARPTRDPITGAVHESPRGNARSQGNLPAIKSSYEADYRGALVQSPRYAPIPAMSRVDVLEDRLHHQEKTTQSLIDRAYKIKEDIIDNLNLTHNTWQEEKHQRELLQDHIRTITDVVRKLNKDIQSMEEQVKAKEGAIMGTGNSVKNLELHHMAGITDLRGRVARSDAGIAKLAQDVAICQDNMKAVTQQSYDQQEKLLHRLQAIDIRVADLTKDLEHNKSEQQLTLHHLQGDSTVHITQLDTKTQSKIEEVRGTMTTFKLQEESEREKQEARFHGYVEKSTAFLESKLDKLEKKMDENVNLVMRRVDNIEDDLLREKERNAALQKALEGRVQGMLDSGLRRHGEEVARLKRECREGFSTVHESITNMKQVLDGKRKLLEEQLRKEISEIRKMVVLI